jgi:hypothetical protein
MAKGSTYEADILNLALNAIAISSFAATAGTTTLWNALHTADPSGGNQTTQEVSSATFTGYSRVASSRTSGAWSVTGFAPATASPSNAITWAQLTSTSTGTATYWSIGHSSAGTGKIYYSGQLSPSINLGQNVTPQITTGSSVTES